MVILHFFIDAYLQYIVTYIAPLFWELTRAGICIITSYATNICQHLLIVATMKQETYEMLIIVFLFVSRIGVTSLCFNI